MPGVPAGPRSPSPPLAGAEAAACAAPLQAAARAYRSSGVPLRVALAVALVVTGWAVGAAGGGGGLRARWAAAAAAAAAGAAAVFAYALLRVVRTLRGIEAAGHVLEVDGDRACVAAVYSERLGNNLLQWCAARERAAMANAAFRAPALAPPFAALAVRAPAPREPAETAASAAASPLRLCAALRAHPCGLFGAGAWLAHPSSGAVINSRLFCGREGVLRGWLAAAMRADAAAAGAAAAAIAWAPTDVAVHVRLGDIVWGHHAAYRPLPMSYYAAALRAVAARREVAAVGRVVIIAEDPTDDIVQRMVAVMSGWLPGAGRVSARGASAAADFCALASAPNIVLSVSTFAWCAAWAGAAEVVVLPDWGLLRAHVWQPLAGGAPVPHDLGLRDGDWVDAAAATVLAAARTPAILAADAAVRAAVGLAIAHAAVFGLAPPPADAQQDGDATRAVATLSPDALAALTADARAAGFLAGGGAGADAAANAIYAAIAQRLPALRELVLREAARVVRIPLPDLGLWHGHYAHTTEALFDTD